MVFGAELVLLGFEVFFFVVFLAVLFFAVLFLAGAFFAVVLGAEEVELCACAAYGTVDAPTNASKANAEINAFILWYS
jgi:hypothetical protein